MVCTAKRRTGQAGLERDGICMTDVQLSGVRALQNDSLKLFMSLHLLHDGLGPAARSFCCPYAPLQGFPFSSGTAFIEIKITWCSPVPFLWVMKIWRGGVRGTAAVIQRCRTCCNVLWRPNRCVWILWVHPVRALREEIPWCGIKMRLGRKMKAANSVTDDISLLPSSATTKKFKCFAVPLPLPPNLQKKNSNIIFFFFPGGNSTRHAIHHGWYIALQADCWQLMALLSGFAYLAV